MDSIFVFFRSNKFSNSGRLGLAIAQKLTSRQVCATIWLIIQTYASVQLIGFLHFKIISRFFW